jgi:hypothetical protein
MGDRLSGIDVLVPQSAVTHVTDPATDQAVIQGRNACRAA